MWSPTKLFLTSVSSVLLQQTLRLFMVKPKKERQKKRQEDRHKDRLKERKGRQRQKRGRKEKENPK